MVVYRQFYSKDFNAITSFNSVYIFFFFVRLMHIIFEPSVIVKTMKKVSMNGKAQISRNFIQVAYRDLEATETGNC